MCPGSVSSFCSTSGTRRVNLFTNPTYLPVVSSRMSKCTRPGRLSFTKHASTVGIIDPCTEKIFIDLNPVDKNFAVKNFTGYINVAHS